MNLRSAIPDRPPALIVWFRRCVAHLAQAVDARRDSRLPCRLHPPPIALDHTHRAGLPPDLAPTPHRHPLLQSRTLHAVLVRWPSSGQHGMCSAARERGLAIPRDRDEARDNAPRGEDPWVKALRFSTVGLEFGVGAVLGYWAGGWLDRRFGTQPYLALVGLLLGIAAAFVSLVRLAREAERDVGNADDGADEKGGDGAGRQISEPDDSQKDVPQQDRDRS